MRKKNYVKNENGDSYVYAMKSQLNKNAHRRLMDSPFLVDNQMIKSMQKI